MSARLVGLAVRLGYAITLVVRLCLIDYNYYIVDQILFAAVSVFIQTSFNDAANFREFICPFPLGLTKPLCFKLSLIIITNNYGVLLINRTYSDTFFENCAPQKLPASHCHNYVKKLIIATLSY